MITDSKQEDEEVPFRETVGTCAVKLMQKGDQKQPVIETQRAMQKNYFENLIECANRGLQQYGRTNPFYICVQTRRERLLPNVIRSQFYVRQTRPLPTYDLALFWYNPKEERLEFVWCIPDKESFNEILLSGGIDPEQRDLYAFCKSFRDGTLI